MDQLKRLTVCMLTGHKWVQTGYLRASDGESAGFSCDVGDVGDAAWRTTTQEPLPWRHRPTLVST